MAQILGMDSLLKKMYYLGTIADPDELDDIGRNMENSAKALAPVKTGKLRDSIESKVTTEGKRTTIKLYAGVNYAVYIENGTSKMPAQPFLKPAFNKHKDEVTRKVRNNIHKVVK